LEVSKSPESSSSQTRSFPGRYESLGRIGDFVRQIAQDAGFESFAVYSIEMAVDEACSNIIEHAYGGEDKGVIHCTCSVSNDSLTITLQDQGISFDPSKIAQPNLSKNLDERQANGLGLYFIRKWMDEVVFQTSRDGNMLKMVKRR
jgi:serine/threonine-protein kinase RsbW